MQSKLLNRGPEKTFALILQYGEDPMEELKKFATKEMLQACRFTAVGAFSEAEVGFFDLGIHLPQHPARRFGEDDLQRRMRHRFDQMTTTCRSIPLPQHHMRMNLRLALVHADIPHHG